VGKLTGLLPSAADSETVSELFLKGTEPESSSADCFTMIDGKPVLALPPEFAAWCQGPWNYLDAVPAPDTALAITTPRQNATYEISDVLPATQQMIEFAASAEQGVRWFVNGRQIEPQADGRVMWRLQPGQWQVTAIAGAQQAGASFMVETP